MLLCSWHRGDKMTVRSNAALLAGSLLASLGAQAEQWQVLCISLFLQPLDRNKAQRGRVHAIALASWCWPIVEHMAEMRISLLRARLGAGHKQLAISVRGDIIWLQRLGKARPAGA